MRPVLPAHERFHCVHLPGGARELGLVVEFQFASFQRCPELAGQRQAAGSVRVVSQVVDHGTILGFLGQTKRDIRTPQQIFRRSGVFREERDADAGPNIEGQSLQDKWRAERALQALSVVGGVQLVFDGEQNSKLVPAKPRHGPLLAELGFEPGADLTEEDVPVLVPERSVDVLKMVKIHQEERLAGVRAVRGENRLTQAVEQQRPVRESGERIVGRLLFKGGKLRFRRRVQQA